MYVYIYIYVYTYVYIYIYSLLDKGTLEGLGSGMSGVGAWGRVRLFLLR